MPPTVSKTETGDLHNVNLFDMTGADTIGKAVYIVQVNIQGNVNGNIIETNTGTINQSYGCIKEMDPKLEALLKKLSEDEVTKEQTQELIKDLTELKSVDEKDKKNLVDKINEGGQKLLSLSQTASALYPIAVQAVEAIKSFIG